METRLIIPIVEGHGEVEAVPLLLRRIWTELVQCGHYLEVLKPLRGKRMKLVQDAEITRLVRVAVAKLQGNQPNARGLVLILFDRDPDQALACETAPKLAKCLQIAVPHVQFSIVIADWEFETWFVAGAASLSKYLNVEQGSLPIDPESAKLGKGWIEARFRGVKYSETLDQPRMTATMDLKMCRRQSRSFDKLCRELETWCKN